MQVALYCPYTPVEGSGEGFHLRPAQAALVVGVVSQAAVGRDDFGRNTGGYQVLDLRDTGKSRFRHSSPFLRRVRFGDQMIRFTKAAGPRAKGIVPPLLSLYLSTPIA